MRTLNSDPVLIYAKDTMNLRDLHITQWPDYVFWTYDGISSAADFEVDPDLESYQVWHSRGLPIGPIASPGVASLQAALNPDTQDGYLYFLGKNDGSGDLVFARTYAEHLQNIQLYLGGSPGPSDEPSFGVPRESSAHGVNALIEAFATRIEPTRSRLRPLARRRPAGAPTPDRSFP